MEGAGGWMGPDTQEIWAENLTHTTPGDGPRALAPPVERDDREPGRQRSRERYKDRERQKGDQEAQTGTRTLFQRRVHQSVVSWAVDAERERAEAMEERGQGE